MRESWQCCLIQPHPPRHPEGGNAYNQAVVDISSSSRSYRVGKLAAPLGWCLAAAFCIAGLAHAQTGAEIGPAAGAAGGRILLVLPFDNRTGQPSLEWIREASAEILSSRFASAGFAPMSRADRLYALDHLGLPQGFHPSRASSLKLAETLDADAVIVGSYVTDGSGIVAEARVVDVPNLRISEQVTARGEMRDLFAVFSSLAWKLTRQLDPGFSGSEDTFKAASAGQRLDAFEQYIRGITEPDHAERLRHLNSAVLLSPGFSPAWMALGREDYAGQQYEQAASAFAKVRGNDADALEAGFYRGLSLLFSGDYASAEEAFGGVAQELPLAEVLSNRGVALARQGKDGIPYFRQAVASDPNVADYHYNLAISLKRRGDTAEALTELAQCLRLSPNDREAEALQKAWTSASKPRIAKTAAAKTGPAKALVAGPAESTGDSGVVGDAGEFDVEAEAAADPLERIERGFDAVAFRQVAVMLDQMQASRLAALPPRERAQKLSEQAKEYLDRGLLLEAERLYQLAVVADGKGSEAHAGLAEIRERTGDAKAARDEALTSLKLMPSEEAYLVMIRLDIAAGKLDEAKQEIAQALKLTPQSRAVQELLAQIETMEGQKK
jgi:tetratricopeptide (TPR) repeat protein